MPSTVEQLSPTRVKITVEVPFSELKPNLDKAYREVAAQVNIPGFRRGKVPPVIIDQRFGRGMVLSEAVNAAIPDLYGRAVSENSLSPLGQPEVEVTRLEDGNLVEFTAEVDVRPDFALPAFDDLSATVDAAEVPDSLIEEQLDTLRERFGSLTPVDRPVADSDHVTINLVARQDGQPLDDATAVDMPYVVGSGALLDGLDEALDGMSAGESRTFTATLAGGPHGGEEAEVEVTLTKVQEQELPDADDEFAQTTSEFDTITELRDNIRERLTEMARLEQASAARDAVLQAVLDRVQMDVPEQVLAGEVSSRKEQIQNQLAAAQLDLDDYLSETGEAENADAFWADVENRARDSLRAQLLLDKVAEERQIGVDQDDLTAHILRRAQAENADPQEVASHLQEHPHHIGEYMGEIRRAKALAQIVEAADVTDANGQRVQLAGLREDGSLDGPEEQDGAAETVAEGEDAAAEATPATEQETAGGPAELAEPSVG